jgi:outer membrane protein OmpA-like peptidoglycan-associated protein
LATAVVLLAAGVSLKVLHSPARPDSRWTTGPSAIPTKDFTAYTAPTGILFDVASADLRPEAIPVLRAIVTNIAGSRRDGIVRVEGYTDDVGSDDYNLTLSANRASRVAAWLVDHAGVAKARIQVIPYGEASPAQPNDSEVHKQANRRVIIRVQR